MRRTVFLICMLAISLARGQESNEIDSLKKVIAENIENPCESAKAGNRLTFLFGENNQDSTLVYLELSKTFAESCGDDVHIVHNLINKGAFMSTKWPLNQLIRHYDSLSETSTVKNHKHLQAMIANNIARDHNYQGNYEESITSSLEALKLYEELGNQEGIANLGYNLGVIYYNQNQYQLALEKFKDGVIVNRKLGKRVREAYCLNGISAIYLNLDSLDLSLKYTKELMLLADELDNVIMQGAARTALGGIYGEQENYEDARRMYLEALPFIKQYGNELMTATCYCNLAAAESFLELYEDAKRHLDKAYSSEIARESLITDDICLKIRGTIYQNMGLYKEASDYYVDYINYQDSVLLKENKEIIAELEEKYESTKRDAEIESQEAEINQKTYQRNLLFGGFGLSILLGSSIIWGLISRSNRDKKIAVQNQHLNHQKIQTLEQEKKLLSMSSLLEGQENERIRIAKDLHDGLGGLLTNVKAQFNKIQTEIENLENLNVYSTANQMIDRAYDEVRRISHNLMPADLRAGGLPVAVRQLVHELRTIHETKTDFELVGFTDQRLNEKVELTVYRITQELINNIVKYADATSVFVQLSKFQDEIQIVVEDDGKGFLYDEALYQNGLGLKSILSRVQQLNGHMDVVTSPGKGASFTINIPIAKAN